MADLINQFQRLTAKSGSLENDIEKFKLTIEISKNPTLMEQMDEEQRKQVLEYAEVAKNRLGYNAIYDLAAEHSPELFSDEVFTPTPINIWEPFRFQDKKALEYLKDLEDREKKREKDLEDLEQKREKYEKDLEQKRKQDLEDLEKKRKQDLEDLKDLEIYIEENRSLRQLKRLITLMQDPNMIAHYEDQIVIKQENDARSAEYVTRHEKAITNNLTLLVKLNDMDPTIKIHMARYRMLILLSTDETLMQEWQDQIHALESVNMLTEEQENGTRYHQLTSSLEIMNNPAILACVPDEQKILLEKTEAQYLLKLRYLN